ncbi:hypothetical protein GW17_00058706 [Ensete ventricosum]|nr:hypothetical protein GW17_00058706 [Ensete ventricosum]
MLKRHIDIIAEVVERMTVPMAVLNVTSMGTFRSDGCRPAIGVSLESQMLGMNLYSPVCSKRVSFSHAAI